MILYDSPVSGNCYKVRLLAAHLGLPLERRPLDVVDRSNRPEVIGDKNPSQRVPTLVLDDGRPLGESGAILWYLAPRHALRARGRLRRGAGAEWMFFEQYDIEPNIAVARFWLAISGEPGKYADALPAKLEGGNKALAALERHLAGRAYLVGDR